MIGATDSTVSTARKNLQSALGSVARVFGQREAALVVVIVVFALIMSSITDLFMRPRNIESILMGLTVNATIATGMMIVFVSGGLDLSVGSNLAFAGVVTGLALTAVELPVPFAILVGLASATAVGAVNGFLVAWVGINPFITTLGMMITVRGLLRIFSGGTAVLNLPATFNVIGQGRLFGYQFPLYVMIIVVVVLDILLRHSRFFRQMYYVGVNEKSAALSGIRVRNVRMFSFCLAGLMAGLAGIMLTARFGSASITVGQGLELRVITAVILGGASLKGGEGTIFGAFLGALFMAMLANALNVLGVGVYWQEFVTGLTLIVAVVVDVFNQKRQMRVQEQKSR